MISTRETQKYPYNTRIPQPPSFHKPRAHSTQPTQTFTIKIKQQQNSSSFSSLNTERATVIPQPAPKEQKERVRMACLVRPRIAKVKESANCDKSKVGEKKKKIKTTQRTRREGIIAALARASATSHVHNSAWSRGIFAWDRVSAEVWWLWSRFEVLCCERRCGPWVGTSAILDRLVGGSKVRENF